MSARSRTYGSRTLWVTAVEERSGWRWQCSAAGRLRSVGGFRTEGEAYDDAERALDVVAGIPGQWEEEKVP